MNKIRTYFAPPKEKEYFNQLKSRFFVNICLFGIAAMSLAGVMDLIYKTDNFVIAITSKVATLVFLLFTLFLNKRKGIVFTGNFFSVGIMVLLLIFVNYVPHNVDPIAKYTQGYYTVFAYMVMAALFAERRIILVNAGLILFTTTHVLFEAIAIKPEQETIYRSGYIYHTVLIAATTFIMYSMNRFVEMAIHRAESENRISKQRNQELLASEEEIRAANEELVATTDALVKSNEQLRLAKNKAEESDNLKTEFLNNMSHEVRTPMNGIIGFSQLLDIPDLDKDTFKYYTDIIQKSSKQLLLIIDNIIEISKLGTKQVKVVANELNLNKLLHDLNAVFKIEANEKNLDLKVSCELPDANAIVKIDELKIYKVLSNLIENALKFTQKGCVCFGYKIVESATSTSKNKEIQFFVEDTGIGINEESKELVFSKFRQATNNLSREYGGLGLGLSIAKENTELMGGRIVVNSILDKGSVFYVNIPYIKAANG